MKILWTDSVLDFGQRNVALPLISVTEIGWHPDLQALDPHPYNNAQSCTGSPLFNYPVWFVAQLPPSDLPRASVRSVLQKFTVSLERQVLTMHSVMLLLTTGSSPII